MKPIIQIIFYRPHIDPNEIQRIHDYIISLGWTHIGTGHRPGDPRTPIDNESISTYAYQWLSDQELILPDLPEGAELYRRA